MSAATTSSLAPHSAHTSAKRARLLFDNSADTNASNHPNPLAAATSAFIPPLFDTAIHKASINRRIRLHYPSEVGNLEFEPADNTGHISGECFHHNMFPISFDNNIENLRLHYQEAIMK